MNEISRRTVLKGSMAAGAAMLLPGARALGANEEIRVALVGMGGKGMGSIDMFESQQGVRIVAFADPDDAHTARANDRFEKSYGRRVETFNDCRKVFEHKDVDAVYCSTPNHWHALQTIWAIEAGKDVYIEKPVCHNIWEGRQMVRAQEKSDRIVQGGFQNRSDVGLREFFHWFHEEGGKKELGGIKLVRGFCYRRRDGIGAKLKTPLKPHAGLNYDHWLGPADDLPIERPKLHYDWHWIWNTGCGDIGNQGPHELDLVRWALNDPEMPSEAISLGGRFAWNDAGETPNMQLARFDFEEAPVQFEVRDLNMAANRKAAVNFRGIGVGIIIECPGGEFRGGRGGGHLYDADGKRIRSFKGDSGGGHAKNFIKAVRSRKQSDLNTPLESAYKSSCMAHLANISYRLGTPANGYEIAKALKDDDTAMGAIGRFCMQLQDNNVDPGKTPMTLGPLLSFDHKKERFIGQSGDKQLAQANAMLTRAYRKEYKVPEMI